MCDMNTLRGHVMHKQDGEWFFVDTDDPVVTTWKSRPCGYCGLETTPEGYDGCIGKLPGVMSACCGHGDMEEAYIQYPDGSILQGLAATNELPIISKDKSNE